jgi:hypothetical protein
MVNMGDDGDIADFHGGRELSERKIMAEKPGLIVMGGSPGQQPARSY